MNDPRFQFSETVDHNLKDPNGSRLLSQTKESNSNMCSDEEFVQFRPNSNGVDSGVCSPPLWKNSPSPSRPLLSHHAYRSLTPSARLQAIARGQKELMEMVKNMPESSYELSLKDLVEHRGIEGPTAPERVVVKVKRQESKKSERNLVRNGSFELERKGMFLKMGWFPFSLQLKKRRNLDRSFSGRKIAGEGDWWKKKLSGSSGSDSSSGRTSNNSGGGGGGGSSRSSSGGSSSYGDGRKNSSSRTGCWPFFRSKNSKTE